MNINQIKPSKVKLALVIKDDYHMKAGQIVRVYWNKQAKEYRTLTRDHDQNGKSITGNWPLRDMKIVSRDTHPELWL